MKKLFFIFTFLCVMVGCVKVPEAKAPAGYFEMLQATNYTQTLHDKTYTVDIDLNELNINETKEVVLLEENNCKVTLIMNRYLQDLINTNAQYKYEFILDFKPSIKDLTYSTYSTYSYSTEENTSEEKIPLKILLKSAQGEYTADLYSASLSTENAPNTYYYVFIEDKILDALKTEENITATITIEGFYYQEGSNDE